MNFSNTHTHRIGYASKLAAINSSILNYNNESVHRVLCNSNMIGQRYEMKANKPCTMYHILLH